MVYIFEKAGYSMVSDYKVYKKKQTTEASVSENQPETISKANFP